MADADGDGVAAVDDCDDGDADVFPGADEICNGVDDDCDGQVDEADDVVDPATWYVDSDGDGFGDSEIATQACEARSGYVGADGDCDDADATVHPDAVEVCDPTEPDPIDNDCDGLFDDDDDSLDGSTGETWYLDADGDGYGDASSTRQACERPDGYVDDDEDCDDGDADVHPAGTEVCDPDDTDEDCDGLADDADSDAQSATMTRYFPDADGDGYGDSEDAGGDWCDDPSTTGDSWVTDATDCDDGDVLVHPGAAELCDELDVDEDCDGLADDEDDDATGTVDTWPDEDGDGFGSDRAGSTPYCDPPPTVSTDATDCDDRFAEIHPGATELCNGVDDDCDGSTDPDDSADADTWYLDADGDGYGDADTTTTACSVPSGYTSDASDCDDGDSGVHPGALEVCDALDVDEDCDGLADDDDPGVLPGTLTWYYPDGDGDGFGDSGDAGTPSCEDPSSADDAWVTDASDCDDGDAGVNPDAVEVCDELDVDEDCNGLADDADVGVTGTTDTWPDADGDGYGSDSAAATPYCDPPSSFVADASDCDDGAAGTYPGATEYCEGSDEDCDGTVDDDCILICPVYVDPGLLTSGVGTDAEPYASIAAAIAGRDSSCDEIVLMAGTYDENMDFGGEDLYIWSESGSASTIIEPTSGGNVVTFDTGESAAATLEGVTLTGGTRGLYIDAASPTLVDVVVDDNSSSGVYLRDADPSFEGCSIQNNGSSTTDGGGLYLEDANPTFTDTDVTSNIADYGGGAYLVGDSTLSGLTIQSNRSYTYGGGVYADTVTGEISGNQLLSNSSTYTGGGMYVDGGTPLVEGNLIQENRSSYRAAGVYLTYASALFFNNVLYANDEDGLYLHYDDSWIMHNTIVDTEHYGIRTWGNYPTSVVINNIVTGSTYYDTHLFYGVPYSTETWETNDIVDGSAGICGSRGNICDDANLDSDHRPSWPSRVIDAGQDLSSYGVSSDHDGNDRFLGPAPDLGAFEPYGVDYDCVTDTGDVCGTSCPAVADPTVLPGGDGTASDPYPSIAYALYYRMAGCDEILLEPGTFLEVIDFGGEDLSISSSAGAASTIIDASGGDTVVTIDSGETSAATLEGVTLTGGVAGNGAGLYVVNSDPTITDCIIQDNVASSNGGGAYLSGYGGTISGTTFEGNETEATSSYGGGVYLYNSTGTITDCTFTENESSFGGGLYLSGGTPTVEDSWFEANSASAYGALLVSGANALVANNIFVDNDTTAIHLRSDTGSVIANNTITGSLGYGIYVWGTYPVSYVLNNVIADSGIHGALFSSAASRYVVWENNDVYGSGSSEYSGMTDPTGANGNISADPMLQSDYSLGAGSACIDAGQDTSGYGVVDDWAGTARPLGSAYDMGAFESY